MGARFALASASRPFALAGAVLLGPALRFFPIWFGLPYSHARPDETTALGHAAAVLAGDPNPHFFNWPSLTLYLFAGALTAASAIAGTLSRMDHFLIARAVVALAGAGTILVVARIGRQIADNATATIAAVFLAVAVVHVRDSHFATTDVIMTLLVTASLSLLLDARDTGALRAYAIAGLVAGLAASAKYSAAPVAVAVFFARGDGRRGWVAAGIFLVAMAAGFVTGTPYALGDFSALRTDVLYERAHLAAGHAGSAAPAWRAHLSRSLPYGLGPGIFIAAVAGCIPLWRRHRHAAMPLVAFAIVFSVAIGVGRTAFLRYVLPIVPMACLSAAVFVHASSAFLAKRMRVGAGVVAVVLALIVAAPSVVNSAWLDILLARTDTRVLAAEWLSPQLRAEHTLYDAGGDYTKLELGATAFHEWRYDAGTKRFVGAGDRTPEWIVLYDSPLQAYASIDPSLRDLTSARYTLVYEMRGSATRQGGIFDPQDAFFLPIAGFRGTVRPGPNVYVYRRVRELSARVESSPSGRGVSSAAAR